MTIEEAIRDIEECIIPYVGGISLRMAVEALKEQRPRGKWIRQKTQYGYSYTCECSLCGRVIYAPTEDDLSDFPYFHCGADMRNRGEEK